MMVILDTSAAVEVVLNRSSATVISDILMKANWVIAPDLFISEATNVFWKYHQYENLSIELCEESIERTLGLIDDIVDSRTLYKEAFALSCMAQHSVYNMFYLVLARRNNGIFLTMDKDLKDAASKYSIRIK